MAFEIQGNNATCPGQVAVGTRATSGQHVVRKDDASKWRAYVADIDLNAAAPIDLATIAIPSTKYIPTRVFLVNPSADVSAATLGLYSAAAAGGVEVVAPTLLATLTAAGKFQVLSVAALTEPLTAETLYPRLTVAAGGAGIADLVVEFEDISDL